MSYLASRPCAETFRKKLATVPVALSLSILSFLSVAPFAAKSAQAAAFAESSGDFLFEAFSTRPFSTSSSTFTNTITAGSGAEAIATADALFASLPSAQALNTITNVAFSSDAFGSDALSSAFAESEASVIGRFAIAPKTTFSFDFFGRLDLSTAVDRPADFASAILETRYALFNDTAHGAAEDIAALDFLSLFGEINTPTGEDEFSISSSRAVTVNTRNVLNNTGLAKSEESLLIEINGRYERFFAQPTVLTLVELKQGAAFTESQGRPVKVPESSSPFVWLAGISGALLLCQRRHLSPQAYSTVPIRNFPE